MWIEEPFVLMSPIMVTASTHDDYGTLLNSVVEKITRLHGRLEQDGHPTLETFRNSQLGSLWTTWTIRGPEPSPIRHDNVASQELKSLAKRSSSLHHTNQDNHTFSLRTAT